MMNEADLDTSARCASFVMFGGAGGWILFVANCRVGRRCEVGKRVRRLYI